MLGALPQQLADDSCSSTRTGSVLAQIIDKCETHNAFPFKCYGLLEMRRGPASLVSRSFG